MRYIGHFSRTAKGDLVFMKPVKGLLFSLVSESIPNETAKNLRPIRGRSKRYQPHELAEITDRISENQRHVCEQFREDVEVI